MAKTAAIRVLDSAGSVYKLFQYKYVEKGGTRASSQALGVDEHCVIKTLVFEDDRKQPLVALMHGDHQVSTKALARHIGTKSISPCNPATAQKHSGYQVGGTSPFGLKNAMPVYMQASIAGLETIYINAGKRGLLANISPQVVIHLLAPHIVEMLALSR